MYSMLSSAEVSFALGLDWHVVATFPVKCDSADDIFLAAVLLVLASWADFASSEVELSST